VDTSERLAILTKVISRVARSKRLAYADSEDFGQSVHLRMPERNYDIFTRFSGRGSFEAFLTTVVHRMLVDWRNRTRPRWRPSAAAKRLGAEALILERIIYRDGFPLTTAIEVLKASHSQHTTETLQDFFYRLPVRFHPQAVSLDELEREPNRRTEHWTQRNPIRHTS